MLSANAGYLLDAKGAKTGATAAGILSMNSLGTFSDDKSLATVGWGQRNHPIQKEPNSKVQNSSLDVGAGLRGYRCR